jgi:fumarate hydratase subunit beta
MKFITTPITAEIILDLAIGDMVSLSGYIYTGRDAALPKLISLFREGKLVENGLDLRGGVIFHTAVSIAGVGPTSSNKLEIESSIPALSEAGIKLHLGKGAINSDTVKALDKYNAVFAVIPPVTALLQSKILEQRIVAFPEEGMEALHLLRIDGIPAIIAAAHGRTLYS